MTLLRVFATFVRNKRTFYDVWEKYYSSICKCANFSYVLKSTFHLCKINNVRSAESVQPPNGKSGLSRTSGGMQEKRPPQNSNTVDMPHLYLMNLVKSERWNWCLTGSNKVMSLPYVCLADFTLTICVLLRCTYVEGRLRKHTYLNRPDRQREVPVRISK